MSTKRLRLTFVRHGESAFNNMNLVQGQKNPGLSKTGLRQAELVGKRFQGERFDFVYTSDLKRACQTAEIIIRENKVKQTEPIQDVRLRELNLGIWEGWPIAVFRGMLAQQLKIPMAEFVPEEGESRDQLRLRALAFIKDLCSQLNDPELIQSPNQTMNILFVVHGFLIKELVDHVIARCSAIPESIQTKVPNGSISIFEANLQDGELDDVSCKVLYDVSHMHDIK